MQTSPPERVGDWLIAGVLGRGGMGVVYDATHAQTGARAALKTVRAPKQMSISGIRREIHALASVSHPGIVKVLDHGLTEGLPWYAMEYLEGDDLFGWTGTQRQGSKFRGSDAHVATQQLHTGSLAAATSAEVYIEPFLARVKGVVAAGLRPTLTVVRRMCEGLEFVHGLGIVHRDLKPENLIVRPNGMPVLVDFGLMSRFSSHGALSREPVQAADTLLAGTVFYVAPEQIRGEFVDARADLYALGCMLFELLTGSAPFQGSQSEIMVQHLEDPAPRASAVRDGIPEALDALIQRLMAKRPEDRFGHATDVARALIGLGAAEDLPEACPPARSFLYRPALAGRALEVRSVHARLRDAKDGRGGMQFIGGRAGVGKTRLAMEMVRDAKVAGFHVLTGECVRYGPPLHPLVPTLRSIADHCFEHGPLETHRLLRGAEILAAFEPSVGRVFGVAQPDEPSTNRPMSTGRQSVIDVLLDVLRRLAAQKPLLLLLDDVHWMDELTAAALLDWASSGRLATIPMLVLGTHLEGASPAPELLGAPSVRKLALGNLDGDGVAKMVAGMLALPVPPPDLVDYLADLSSGNPFFVAEYLLGAIGRGLLGRDPRGAWRVSARGPWAGGASVDLPGSLASLVEGRLEGLGSEPMRVLGAMAVVGRLAEVRLVQDVAGLLPFDFYDAVADLVSRQILQEPEPDYLRLAHEGLRDAVLRRLDSDEVRRYHGAAASALEARRASLEPSRLGELARHWEAAGQTDAARDAYLPAAEHAFRQFATEEAERLTLAYLRLVPSPTPASVHARLELAHFVYIQHGRLDDAKLHCQLALADARGMGIPHEEAQALRRLAQVHRIVGEIEEAQACGEAAVAVSVEIGADKLRGAALQTLGNVYHDQGHLELARRTFVDALAAQTACGDDYGEGFSQINLGLVDVAAGRYAVARPRYERALEIFEGLGDLRGLGLALHNLSTLLYWHGDDLSAALDIVDRAGEVAGRAGNRRQQTVSLAGSARIAFEMGQIDTARERLEEGLALCSRMEARRGHCYLLVVASELARLVDHDLGAAQRELDACREWVKLHDLHALRFTLLSQDVLIALAAGRPHDVALQTLEEMAAEGVGVRHRNSWRAVLMALDCVRGERPLYWGSAPECLPSGLAATLSRRDRTFAAIAARAPRPG